MRIGPLRELDVQKIKEILAKNNSTCEVTLEPELLDSALIRQTEEHKAHGYTGKSTSYLTHATCLYIHVKTEDLLLIKGELENMGVILKSEYANEIPEVPEYSCIQCGYTQEQDGYCTTHKQTKLIPYFDYVRLKKSGPNYKKMNLGNILVFLLMMILLIAAKYGQEISHLFADGN